MRISFIVILSLFLFSCKKDKNQEEEVETSATMANMADAVIIPSFNEFQIKLDELNESCITLSSNPDEATLANCRITLKSAWLQWQHVSAFTFGPAESRQMKPKFNTFPVDAIGIEDLIQNGDFNSVANDEKGLGCIDYLINERGLSDQEILDKYISGDFAQNRKNLLLQTASQMKSILTAIRNDWTNYRETFVTSAGAANGSSVSLLVNELIKDYEELKRNRIALPLGLLTLGIALPEKVEAYHAGYSSELAREQLQAIKWYFMGGNGLGLDDLLYNTGFMSNNGIILSDAIPQGFDESYVLMLELIDPLSDQIGSNPDPIEQAYFDIQENLVMLKTEMPSALGVSITFADNDGD